MTGADHKHPPPPYAATKEDSQRAYTHQLVLTTIAGSTDHIANKHTYKRRGGGAQRAPTPLPKSVQDH